MGLRLALLERWLPAALRHRMLRSLFCLTAEAFDAPVPAIPAANDEAVGAFACFTRDLVARAGEGASGSPVVHDRLYTGAREIGGRFRRGAGVRTAEDAARALRLLYRAIGIEMAVDFTRSEMTIRRCAFSSVYTPETCKVISALDGGIVDGITGGATVVFMERLTEGAPCCRAALVRGRK